MRLVCLLICVFFLSSPLFAQQPALGFPPFGSFQDGHFDSVNRENLNVVVSIPIVSVPGRGPQFRFSLVYNSSAWSKMNIGYGLYTWVQAGGWYLYPGNVRLWWDTETVTCDASGETAQHFFNFWYQEAAGTRHAFDGELYDVPTYCGYPTAGFQSYATDASGFFLDTTVPNWVTYDRSGVQWAGASTQVDTNGNSLPYPAYGIFTDSIGRQALKVVGYSDHWDYQFRDLNGNLQTIRLNLGAFNLKTNFGCPGVGEGGWSGFQLPTSVVLPNNQQYSFTYEDTPAFPGYTTGRLKRVTLPTGSVSPAGGYYEYQYPTSPNNSLTCEDGTGIGLTRVINDGANSYTWQYTRTKTLDQGNVKTWQTLVTTPLLSYDPAPSQSTYTFTRNLSLQTKELVEKLYQGSTGGQLLLTMDKLYGCVSWTGACTPVSSTVILPTNQQSKVETDYDWNTGNLLETREYDWNGALLRRTTTTYLTTYLGRGISDRPVMKVVKDGSGVIKSRTDFQYDSTGLVCITGAAQHN